jgi:hypothetical protein
MSPTATHSQPAGLDERWARSVGYHAWSMTATRFCIFDMDGVLIDSGAHHRNAWQALLEELEVTPEEPSTGGSRSGGPRRKRCRSCSAGPCRAPRRGTWRCASASCTRLRPEGHAHRARGLRLRGVAGTSGCAARGGHLGLALGRGHAAGRARTAPALRCHRHGRGRADGQAGSPRSTSKRPGGSGRRPRTASSSRTRSWASRLRVAPGCGRWASRRRTATRSSGPSGAESTIPHFEGLEWTALARR